MFKIKYTKGQMVFVVVWLSLMISVQVWGFIGQHTVVIATALIGMTLPIFLLQIVAMDQICKEFDRLKEDKGSVAEEFEKIWDCVVFSNLFEDPLSGQSHVFPVIINEIISDFFRISPEEMEKVLLRSKFEKHRK